MREEFVRLRSQLPPRDGTSAVCHAHQEMTCLLLDFKIRGLPLLCVPDRMG